MEMPAIVGAGTNFLTREGSSNSKDVGGAYLKGLLMSFLSELFPLDDIVSPLPPFPVSFVRFPGQPFN